MKKVLVVATSRKTRGGITAVIKAHEQGKQWKKFHCHWVQTHRDGPVWRKMLYFISGMLDFIVRLPFYDIVHIHTADFGTEKRKRIFAHLTKLLHKKLIVHLHSSGLEYSIAGKHKQLYEYSFLHADRLVFLSKGWMECALKSFNIPSGKTLVLYNPCPIVIPSKKTERKPYILYAGTLTHRKGYDDLLKAFALIAGKHPQWRLKLAGNGEINAARHLAEQLGISDRAEFPGWINGDKKDEMFRHASIYCLPSYSEGFPMGVLDAWAYHLPVVTTPVGGLPDVAIDGVNTILFEPGNIRQLAGKLSTLISDSELYETIESASIKFASETFNIKIITEQLGKIYDSLTSKQAR